MINHSDSEISFKVLTDTVLEVILHPWIGFSYANFNFYCH